MRASLVNWSTTTFRYQATSMSSSLTNFIRCQTYLGLSWLWLYQAESRLEQRQNCKSSTLCSNFKKKLYTKIFNFYQSWTYSILQVLKIYLMVLDVMQLKYTHTVQLCLYNILSLVTRNCKYRLKYEIYI